MNNNNPKIIVFSCSWLPYTAADNAGVGRYMYPPEIRLVKVTCTGVITPTILLKAFINGAHGVMVVGCDRGECHYINGNECCESVVEQTKQVMQLSGIDSNRLRFHLFTDVDGAEFASTVTDFYNRICELQPLYL